MGNPNPQCPGAFIRAAEGFPQGFQVACELIQGGTVPHLVGYLIREVLRVIPLSVIPAVIQAVRRERRVEKALENCRLTDILRWAAADELIIGKLPIGALYTGTDLETHFRDKIYTSGDNQNLWLDANGYILSCSTDDYPNGWQFDPDRDYLLPIRQDMVGSLTGGKWTQNPGW